MAEFLLEIFSEEIPAGMQSRAAAELQTALLDGLKQASIEFSAAASYATPRRLTVVFDELPTEQPDLREERKGPKVGAPEKALQGFLKSVGLDSIDQCDQRDTPKGPVYVAVIERKGRPTSEVLSELASAAIEGLTWPKSMRFAHAGFRWVRPIRSIAAVFDGAVVEGGIDLNPGRLAFGGTSEGHRFMAPGTFPISSFEGYKQELLDRKVILDPEERTSAIEEQLSARASEAGLTVRDDPRLLDEVVGLVEWPVVLLGRIDDAFMSVPPEVLTSSMRAHQKYFALSTPDGAMAARFAVVANIQAPDGGAAIVDGNERVLRARLADAKFFWDQDRKTPLEDRLEDLEKIVFHAKLGSVADRVDRIAALAEALSDSIEGCDPLSARRAAQLAKADLVSGMVYEFPELQGVMGRYYALEQDEDAAVAQAIADHYSPVGPGDACPSAPISVAVALAEKIDTLAGFWLIDEKPTGSKDPFALRRAALGVIRLLLENDVRLPLGHVFGEALGLYGEQGRGEVTVEDATGIVLDLMGFLADRMKVHLKDEGVRHDLITALFALGDEDDLVRLMARAHALRDFVESEDGANLLTAYRRAANILRIEEKKDGASYHAAPDPALFDQDEEVALAAALSKAEAASTQAREHEDFAGSMMAMSALRAPVDGFFDHVTVNAPGAAIRQNRLKLLSRIRAVMETAADFSKVEGD
ncbi:MAG: glycine--tRNA ligase subunit beta [Alphaproteobacteria bacterium]|nr:glycine--tRNA ligase subunit beta [Alphaproteobacteria bacterium]